MTMGGTRPPGWGAGVGHPYVGSFHQLRRMARLTGSTGLGFP